MSRARILDYNKGIIVNKGLAATIGVTFFVLATALGAYVRIPIIGTPVPVTFQTFFVIMAGAVLGKRLGALSQLCYAILSVPFLLGPTGGYFMGFIAASYVVGRMTGPGKSGIGWAVFSFAVGSIIIYTFGILWLSYLLKIDIAKAIYMGALPFIPGDTVKILIAAIIYSGISKRSKEIFSE
ncbi:MAG: biotin transporter BioY [Candidatus Omnitrophota bacterium]